MPTLRLAVTNVLRDEQSGVLSSTFFVTPRYATCATAVVVPHIFAAPFLLLLPLTLPSYLLAPFFHACDPTTAQTDLKNERGNEAMLRSESGPRSRLTAWVPSLSVAGFVPRSALPHRSIPFLPSPSITSPHTDIKIQVPRQNACAKPLRLEKKEAQESVLVAIAIVAVVFCSHQRSRIVAFGGG